VDARTRQIVARVRVPEVVISLLIPAIVQIENACTRHRDRNKCPPFGDVKRQIFILHRQLRSNQMTVQPGQY
jgi:hypothetical protein